jgi:glyoxylate/hydroxypyruvate reductase A
VRQANATSDGFIGLSCRRTVTHATRGADGGDATRCAEAWRARRAEALRCSKIAAPEGGRDGRRNPGQVVEKMNNIVVMLRQNADRWVALLQQKLPQHRVLAEVDSAAGEVAYAVVGKPTPGALRALRGLRVVFSVNAGIEALLESGEVPAGVPIVRMVDDGLAEGMLEWALASVLAWHRNLFAYRASQAAGHWRPLEERLARDRTATVLGAGHLGARVAAALAGLGFVTRAFSRSPKAIAGVSCLHGAAQLEAAVTGADFLVNLLPLTPATENLIDARLLSRLARGAVLVNGGRGRNVVDEAVLAALDAGQLRAAVLDVFREEPLPASHPFWHHPGVYLSPHVAAPTHAGTAIDAIAANLTAFEGGAPLRHVVDLARGY